MTRVQRNVAKMQGRKERVLMRALAVSVLLGWGTQLAASEPSLADWLRRLDSRVFSDEQKPKLLAAVRQDQGRRLREAERASTAAWREIRTVQDWERFRSEKIAALRQSLGTFPATPEKLTHRVTGTVQGDKFHIDNVLYESRPGWWVTGNLYLPEVPRNGMPGVLISHAHHTPKEQGELQDMGMTWARAGCAVLVIDHLGHGERRQHPFASAADYPEPFRASRQDYWFRYDNNLQLTLAGESLMGWMAWDLMRGVDLLLTVPGVDTDKLILLGAVAGGGDPAGVTAALDDRIDAVVPFNFGGPQPESPYPLPADAETSFRYAGSGSWESTRNLADSASGGFLPWAIVGSVAPRRLIHAHEFSWDREHDPVWKRYQAIYRLYNADDHLAFAHGRGLLSGQPPEASHCTHIGRVHRERIHASFKQWFNINVTAADEYSQRVAPEKLRAWTPSALADLKPQSLGQQLAALIAARRKERPLSGAEFLNAVHHQLGSIEPPQISISDNKDVETHPGARLRRIPLVAEPGIPVPLLLIQPEKPADPKSVVLCIAQQGKQEFLKHRAVEIVALLRSGIAVCLMDVRGTAEMSEDTDRGRTGVDTDSASNESMLGGTMLGARLRDVRMAVRYLKEQEQYSPQRIGLWGDSFVAPNAVDVKLIVPHGVEKRPAGPEPTGGLLALLAAEAEQTGCVYIRGAVCDFSSALSQPVALLPQDAVIPGLLALGDFADLVGAAAPRPVRLDQMVDSLNRSVVGDSLDQILQPARKAYGQANAADRLSLDGSESPAEWFARELLRRN